MKLDYFIGDPWILDCTGVQGFQNWLTRSEKKPIPARLKKSG